MNELPQHVREAFDFAMALWPESIAARSEAVMLAWAPKLARFPLDVLRQALYDHAVTGGFPTLAEWLEGAEAVARSQAEPSKLPAPRRAATVEERLRQFDESAASNRSPLHAELAVAQRDAEHRGLRTLSADELAKEAIAIDKVGHWETVARRAVEAGYEPGRTAWELLQIFSAAERRQSRPRRAVDVPLVPEQPSAVAEELAQQAKS